MSQAARSSRPGRDLDNPASRLFQGLSSGFFHTMEGSGPSASKLLNPIRINTRQRKGFSLAGHTHVRRFGTRPFNARFQAAQQVGPASH